MTNSERLEQIALCKEALEILRLDEIQTGRNQDVMIRATERDLEKLLYEY